MNLLVNFKGYQDGKKPAVTLFKVSGERQKIRLQYTTQYTVQYTKVA